MSRRRKPNSSSQPVPEIARQGRKWYKVDLHLHTPASRDYEEPKVTYLEWLRKVVEQGLEMVAITDHNTVAGIGAIRRELEWLTRLEQQDRLNEEERQRLNDWRTLGNQVVVLPGFEFTATFGFHILALFPPETSVRHLEHVLLSLKVPAGKLDEGSTETGATTDVLAAYRVIREAGGLVVAAHANSTHGVAMRNFPFGGQTKIAYTQDPNLDALEVTDIDRAGRSTARFFNGSKAEYPRRMHCLQGSDAHRLTTDPRNPKRLGVGARATEVMLDEPTFDALAGVLRGRQFDRVRPAQPADVPFDALDVARQEGPSLVQSFHETATERGGKLALILADLCAFANTAGGAVFVGAKAGKGKAKGLVTPTQTEQEIRRALDERLIPPLEVKCDVVQSQGAKVLRFQVTKGPDVPYALDGNKFYVRDESETSLAVRDEIVALVKEALGFEQEGEESGAGLGERVPVTMPVMEAPLITSAIPEMPITPATGAASRSARGRRRRGSGRAESAVAPAATPASPRAQTARRTQKTPPAGPAAVQAQPPLQVSPADAGITPPLAGEDTTFYLPQIGVEIVDSEERGGNFYHTIRDLRNGHVIKNVTRKGARKLWSYALQQHEDNPVDPTRVQWQGNVGLVHVERRAGKLRYDLALREADAMRVFYGVTEDGMEGAWEEFIREE